MPISSRNQTLSVIKQSSLKYFEHNRESDDGPSQLLCCRFTALTCLLLKALSLGNLWKLYPFPLTVLQPAAMQRLGIVNGLKSFMSLQNIAI